MECSTCLEVREVKKCHCEQCDWTMCTDCGDKWYTHNTRCPACRNENIKAEPIRGSCYTPCLLYVLISLVILVLGRLVTMLFGIVPSDFGCHGNVRQTLQFGMQGAVLVLFLICWTVGLAGTCVMMSECVYIRPGAVDNHADESTGPNRV